MKRTFFLSAALLCCFAAAFYSITLRNSETHRERGESPGETDALKSFEWWYTQRAFPHQFIPPNAFQKAAQYLKRSMRKEVSRRITGIETSTQWRSLGPTNIGGRTLALAVDRTNPNIVWAGSASGGLWKSTSGGTGANPWSNVNTGFNALSISSIVIDPTDHNVMYLGTGEISLYHRPLIGTPGARASYGMGILKSTDAGSTWSQSGLTFTFPQITAIQKIIINPQNTSTLFAATSEGIYRSYDAGVSWSRVDTVLMAMDVVMNPLDTLFLCASHGNSNSSPNPGIYLSNNGGDDWFQVGSGLPSSDFGRTALTLADSNPSIIYAGVANANSGGAYGIYRSTNSGMQWTQVSSVNYCGTQGWYDNVVAVKPNDPSTVYSGGLDIYRSTQNGTASANISAGAVHVDQHAIVFDPTDYNIMYFGCDGGIWKSTNGGSTFINCNQDYVTTQFYSGFAVSPTDSNLAFGGLQDNGTLKYSGSRAWSQVLGADGGWCAINPANNNIVYGEYQNLVPFKSTNGGATFSSLWIPSTDTANFIAPFVLAPSSPNVLYAGLKNVYKSTNAGSTWFPSNGGGNFNGTNVATIGVSWTSADTLMAATGTGTLGQTSIVQLFASANGGRNWSNITRSLPNRYLTGITFDPTNSSTVYITFSGYGTPHVFKTTNFGQGWTDISSNLPDIPHQAIAVDPLSPQDLYVGTDLGVFHSSNGGTSWNDFNSGMPAAMVLDLKISPANGTIRAATFGNGIYERELARVPQLSLISPAGGEMLEGGALTSIKWSEQFMNAINIEATTDGGESWELVAGSVPAGLGSYTWTVPVVSTSSARVRVSDAVAGEPADSSHSTFSILLNPDISLGWNLVSLSVQVTDPRKSALYPSASSAAFSYNGSYRIADTILNGIGYWLKFPEAAFTSMSGTSIHQDTISLHEGWNMIGTLSSPVTVVSVIEMPAGIVSSHYFGYHSSGYYPADTLFPKRGYWVKASSPGRIALFSGTAVERFSYTTPAQNRWTSLTFRDVTGAAQTLLVATEFERIQSLSYELPPLPPGRSFDISFPGRKMVGILDESAHEKLPITFTDLHYPLTVSWHADGFAPSLELRLDGKGVPLDGEGRMIVREQIREMSIASSIDNAAQRPTSYRLEQNYPNPFNPSTTIRYELPHDSRVRITIYNSAGQRVATLLNGRQSAGAHHVTWDGAQHASGIYFCEMLADRYRGVKKMVMIR